MLPSSIKSLPDAETALAEAQVEITAALAKMKRAQAFIVQFRTMMIGAVPKKPDVPNLFEDTAEPPGTYGEGIIAILEQSPNPLKTIEIVREYEKRPYPKPETGKLYDAISATISYLKKKGKIYSENGMYAPALEG